MTPAGTCKWSPAAQCADSFVTVRKGLVSDRLARGLSETGRTNRPVFSLEQVVLTVREPLEPIDTRYMFLVLQSGATKGTHPATSRIALGRYMAVPKALPRPRLRPSSRALRGCDRGTRRGCAPRPRRGRTAHSPSTPADAPETRTSSKTHRSHSPPRPMTLRCRRLPPNPTRRL